MVIRDAHASDKSHENIRSENKCKKRRPPSVGGRRGLLGCSGVFWGEDGIIETQKESVRKKRREGVIESTGIT